MIEKWKPIKGYEGFYEVSNFGRIRSYMNTQNRQRDIPKIRYGFKEPSGNVRIQLSKNGYNKYYLMHKLVIEAFIKKPKNKHMVTHIDGDRSNNKLDNLKWISFKENTDSSASKRYKLQTQDVIEIKKALRSEYPNVDLLALTYGVLPQTIKNIQENKSWTNIKV